MGINVKKDFEPEYLINPDKQQDIKRLKADVEKAETVYLATDPDREGEAISWHLSEVLGLDDTKPIRIEFHEVSEKAVKNALANPRVINKNLVDAQQARRVLDRIVGYSISPAASVRLSENLSAGRVQSVALKMVVDREREIQAFKPQEYWLIRAFLQTEKGGKLKALLQEKDGKKYRPSNAEETEEVLNTLKTSPFVVKNVKKSVIKVHAQAPFTTSTMQQDGVLRLGLTSPQVMSVAQKLYEGVETPNGHKALITYMRTDSVRVSPDAQKLARDFIEKTYGEEYVPTKPNFYKTKGEAQDAHEAIRPIDVRVTPDSMKSVLDKNQYRLYKLIYDRFIASQMSEAKYNSVVIDIDSANYTFRTSGRTEVFAGYTAVYKEAEKEKTDDENENGLLPPVENGENLGLEKLEKEQKFTKPPVRYTEATLIKAMEVEGIGRPSTYATIMGKLSDKKRAYVSKEKNYLVPTEISYPLIDFLVRYFPDVMDLKFTRRMETALDDIGDGGKDWHKLIADFYKPFENQVKNSKITDVICKKCGAPMEIRSGKFGKFGNYYACTNYPECHNIVPVNEKVVIPTEYICEKCGGVMVEREGKFGKFLACSNYPKCKNTKNLSGEERPQRVEETEGVCPDCGKPTRKMTSKSGKIFYGCTGYPDCKFMSWDKPVGEKCSECGGAIVEINGKKQCSNKRCPTNK
jgi:DNA topoisomerase-1